MDYREFLDSVDRKAYHEGEWRWQEGEYTVTRTNHWSPPGCHNGCGVLLYVDKDGKLAHIEGDPLAPFNGGKLCMRCLDMVEAVNHPDRLKYPLRRAGKRGENKWERISWDEAYDEIVERVNKVKEEFGSHTILFVHGTGRNIGWQLPLFASHGARDAQRVQLRLHRLRVLPAAHDRRVGQDGRDDHHRRVGNARAALRRPDVPPPRRHHGVGQRAAEVQRRRLHRPLDRRVHADGHEDHLHRPAPHVLGAKAEVWLQVRPGTDGALGIAMLNTIINEDLVDHDFIDKWCYGYEQLVDSVQGKDAEWAAEICDVPAEDIRTAARLYANAESASIQWGLAFEQQLSALGVTAAACDLMGVTGNIDNPGGNLLIKCAFDIEKRYGLGDFKIPRENYAGKLTLSAGIESSDIVACASSDALLHAVETGEPFMPQIIWLQSANPLSCSGMDAPRMYEAINKIPTAWWPTLHDAHRRGARRHRAARGMSCERNAVRTWWTPARSISQSAPATTRRSPTSRSSSIWAGA